MDDSFTEATVAIAAGKACPGREQCAELVRVLEHEVQRNRKLTDELRRVTEELEIVQEKKRKACREYRLAAYQAYLHREERDVATKCCERTIRMLYERDGILVPGTASAEDVDAQEPCPSRKKRKCVVVDLDSSLEDSGE